MKTTLRSPGKKLVKLEKLEKIVNSIKKKVKIV